MKKGKKTNHKALSINNFLNSIRTILDRAPWGLPIH